MGGLTIQKSIDYTPEDVDNLIGVITSSRTLIGLYAIKGEH